MISSLALAVVLAQAPPQRLSTWRQMADELERTGAIDCPLNPDETRRAADTDRRMTSFPELPLHRNQDGDLRQDNECAVMEISVGKSGQIKTAHVLRYKGRQSTEAAYFGMKLIRAVRFMPANRDWKGLLVFKFGFERNEIPDLVKAWRERSDGQ